MPDSFGPHMTRRTFTGAASLVALGATSASLTACGSLPNGAGGSAEGAGATTYTRTFVDAASGAYAGTSTGEPWVSTNLAHNPADGFSPDATEDFYGHANAEWLKEQKVPEGTHGYRPAIDDAEYQVRGRLRKVLASKDDETSFDIDKAQEAARNYYALLASWPDRDSTGYRGLEIALNEVNMHSTFEDLVTYLFSGGRLTWMAPIIDLTVTRDPRNMGKLLATPRQMLFDVHHSAAATLENTPEAQAREAAWKEETIWLLQKTAYADQASELVETSLAFQKEFAATVVAAPLPKDSQRVITMDEFAKIMSGFPLEALVFSYELDGVNEILINARCEQYCSCLNTILDTDHLEKIKAQIMCALTHAGYDFLTKEAFEHLHGKVSDDTLEDRSVQEVLSTMREPVTALYETDYADEEAKKALEELADEVRDGLKATIEGNEWMRQSTKDAICAKLDKIVLVSMFGSYEDSGLYPEIGRHRDGDYLWSAKRQVEMYRRSLNAQLLSQEAPADYMQQNQTLTSSYSPSLLDARCVYDQVGALQMGAGLAMGVFDASQTQEEKLARTGALIALELTHAFDARGWGYDAEGKPTQLYDSADVTGLGDRTQVVATWFDTAVKPLGEAREGYGERVKINAIAEMCALKGLMKVAETKDGFDYQKFFEAYAHFMQDIQEQELFDQNLAESSAPFASVRVNLALSQLSEFREAYGVEAQDAMATADTEGLSIF